MYSTQTKTTEEFTTHVYFLWSLKLLRELKQHASLTVKLGLVRHILWWVRPMDLFPVFTYLLPMM